MAFERGAASFPPAGREIQPRRRSGRGVRGGAPASGRGGSGEEAPRSGPALDASALDASALDASALDVPALDVPASDVPALDVPALDVPALDVPALDVPASDVPALDVPALDVPASDVPALDVPALDVPALDAPPPDTLTHTPAPRVTVLSPVGAGDAFAAGFLSATLRGLAVKDRLRHGHLAAAAVLTVPGDFAAPPRRDLADRLVALDDVAWGTLHLGPGWTGDDQEVRTP
ncbi:PfkB family carbohydrate kinase [Streptomyces sp. NPDC008122]|uniref:PfkB family carbohydrate kinase n=1 Tax=Streptomyces sp. NPDC008122 TaxID=3364810 RepID=UPI0036EAC9C8